VPRAPPVKAEDEFVEVGLEVLAAQAVVDAQGPDFEVGKDPVHPGQHDVGRHLADDMGLVSEAGSTWISRPAVGLGGGAGGEVGGEKGLQAGGRIIGNLAEANAAGATAAIGNLDSADDQDFALMAAPAAAGERIVLAAADDLGFIDLDKAGERAAAGRQHAAAQLGTNKPRRLVGTKGELALQLQRRDPVGVGGHQICRPEPRRQRQLGVMHDGSGSDRGLPAAFGALVGPGLGLQPPSLAAAAPGADKPVRPTRRKKVLSAGGLVAEALLELDQGARKVGHRRHRRLLSSCFVLTPNQPPGNYILYSRTQRDKASHLIHRTALLHRETLDQYGES
jgi:hypothetical protein